MTTETNRILILSEDEKLIQSLTLALSDLGYLSSASSGVEYEISKILRAQPDVILYDLTDWDDSAISVYKRLRSSVKLGNLGCAFLILISQENLDKLSFTLAFDEMLLSPHPRAELDFRIRRLLWKNNKIVEQETIQIDQLVIYLARYEVWLNDVQLELTFKEYELLKYLASHRGRAFNRESLLNVIWGYEYYGGTRTVDVHIRRIRSKINDLNGHYIKTVRGVGYMFLEAPP